MTMAPSLAYEPPDTIAALPLRPFEFSAAAAQEAGAILAQPPDALFRRLLADQESEAVLLAARRVLDAFLAPHSPVPGHAVPDQDGPGDEATADQIAAQVLAVRAELAAAIGALAGIEPDARMAVVRQRAPLGLLGGCWLDVLSQPATQPSVIVNKIYPQTFTQHGEGNPHRSLPYLRRRRMEEEGVFLPETGAADFLSGADARPLTALHGCFYLSLSRLPANFLPEVVGVNYAFHALGTDDLLSGLEPMVAEPELREALALYRELAGPAELRRLHAAIGLTLELEREHVALLTGLAEWQAGQTLESKVAAVIARHSRYAANQHQQVRVGGKRLADTFTDPGLDIAAFLAEFREARQLQRTSDGLSRFIKAIKFGGPMFGIFDEQEAATFQAWIDTVQAGERPEIAITPNTAGDEQAAARSAAIAAARPADVVIAEAGTPSDRELFYRMVNIENFANTLPFARQYAADMFERAEILFTRGAAGRYTDATYFDFTAEALYERCERVYWDKLIAPYQPLEQVPDRDEVVFLQSTYALGDLIDATWIHRIANTGRFERPADAAIFTIYADEVGHGDLTKNHITLIHRALHSMDIHLPHIRDAAFMDQADLPDELYGFSLHQICMANFPDTYYNEILGYNLAIEMFGLGEQRLHEIQKLRHHGFDDCYEVAHLTIDNISAGHSKQAADIIVSYLDGVRRTLGEAAVQAEWRRVWRGYASFAWFVEHPLLKHLAAEDASQAPAQPEAAEEPASADDESADFLI